MRSMERGADGGAGRRRGLNALLGVLLGVLPGALASTLPAARAEASPSQLRVGRLQLGPEPNPRPTALRRLLWELSQRTAIEVQLDPVPVDPASDEVFRYPLLVWSGRGAVPPLSEEAVRRLRRHLTFGGMLIVDNAEAEPGGLFDRSVRRALARILPRGKLSRVPNAHVLYKSFYLVDHQAGRVLRVPYLEGVQLEDRYAVIYSQNDLAGAWARDAFGRWEYPVSPGGQRQREMSFRLGVNLIMYALCLDYKDDLVHSPFIQRRRE